MAAKLRQLGWICVAPAPSAHASTDAGKSERRVVEPRNTIRTVATVELGPGEELDSSHADTATPTSATAATCRTCAATRIGHLRTTLSVETDEDVCQRRTSLAAACLIMASASCCRRCRSCTSLLVAVRTSSTYWSCERYRSSS